MPLDQQIEAILFYKAEPLKTSALAKQLGVGEEQIDSALKALKERLNTGAIRLILADNEATLAIAPDFDEIIENIRKDEMKRDIGRAGAETLAIIMYRGPVTRADIDRIRGVNSSYILRNLETRGLVERRSGKRQNEYVPTTELMRHLGIQEKTEMPDYAKVMNALEAFERSQEETV